MRLTLTRAALWFGIIMLAVGILGFIPGITNNYYLFHFIKVGVGPNIVHLILGAIALAVAAGTEASARLFFQVVAVAYLVTAVIGLFIPDGQVWGFMDSNWWTELARAVVTLGAAAYAWDLFGEREMLTTRTTTPTFGERMDDRDEDR